MKINSLLLDALVNEENEHVNEPITGGRPESYDKRYFE